MSGSILASSEAGITFFNENSTCFLQNVKSLIPGVSKKVSAFDQQ